MKVSFYQLQGIDAREIQFNRGTGGWADDVIVINDSLAGMIITKIDAVKYNIKLRKFNKENKTNYKLVSTF